MLTLDPDGSILAPMTPLEVGGRIGNNAASSRLLVHSPLAPGS
jgi:hypothetical protein